MALIGINSRGPAQRGLSSLEKIASGLEIATKTIGIPFSVADFVQNKKITNLKEAQATADLGQNTVEAQPGEAGSFSTPIGVRKSTPNLAQVIQRNKVEDLQPPSSQEIDRFRSVLPPGLQEKYSADVVSHMSRGDLTDIQKSLASRDTGYEFQTKNLMRDVVDRSDPYQEGQPVPKGFRVKDYSLIDPSLGKRLIADKVDERIQTKMDEHGRKDEDNNQKAIDKALGIIRGGNKTLANAIAKETQARNALQLLNAPDVIKNRQMTEELAIAIASELSGGTQPAQNIVKNLVPSSSQGDFNNTVQYITGNPQKFLTDGFLNQFNHTLERERKFWENEKNRYVGGIGHGMRPVWDRRPDLKQDFDRALQIEASDAQSVGVTPDDHKTLDEFFKKK